MMFLKFSSLSELSHDGLSKILFRACLLAPTGALIVMMVYLTPRIPNSSSSIRPSQKAPHGDISGAKHGIIDPLVSKRLEKNLKKKIKR